MYAATLLSGALSSFHGKLDKDSFSIDFNQPPSFGFSRFKKSFSWPKQADSEICTVGFGEVRKPRSQSLSSVSFPKYFLQAYSDIGVKLQPALSATSEFSCKVIENAGSLVRTGINLPTKKVNSVIESIAVGIEKLNMDLEENVVTLTQIQEAHKFLKTCHDVVRTPTLVRVEDMFLKPASNSPNKVSSSSVEGTNNRSSLLKDVKLYLKMENMQTTGSFKIRGVMNQMRVVREKHGKDAKLITMSAGNYGKAFAHCVGKSGTTAMCVMPETAPVNRAQLIESMGVQVKRVPTAKIQETVDDLVAKEKYVFCHPFDDLDLIAGYASSAVELLEDVPDPDVVLVCCGGGGLVSGIAAATSLSKLKGCRVYAVEPETAPTMFESFKARRPITIPQAKSIAAGLAPPYAGSNCYKHCRWFVEDVLTVSDEEIVSAMRTLFHRGIKAEPSGCAAMAALLSGKVPNVEGKKVVVYVTGGNVSADELTKLMPDSV